MSGRVRESCCENNDAFREGIAHKSLWKLIARKRPPPSFFFLLSILFRSIREIRKKNVDKNKINIHSVNCFELSQSVNDVVIISKIIPNTDFLLR